MVLFCFSLAEVNPKLCPSVKSTLNVHSGHTEITNENQLVFQDHFLQKQKKFTNLETEKSPIYPPLHSTVML